jgi:hypothetical protein
MRNMSFALTTAQIRNRTKTVTRRIGWTFLKPGDRLRAVVQCQGLKKGEHVEELALLRVESVRVEPLRALLTDLDYGIAEVRREGFAGPPLYSSPLAFVEFFQNTHRAKARPGLDAPVTRIAFSYV